MARPRSRPTVYLFRLIELKAQREGTSRESLCSQFGISASYYGQLSSEPTLLAQASRPVIAAIAQYLDVPFVQAQIWAGQLDWADFGRPRNPGATVTQYLDRVALQIEQDEHFRAFAVPLKDWSATPQGMKIRFIALYEHARQLLLAGQTAAETPAALLARAGQISAQREDPPQADGPQAGAPQHPQDRKIA
jgi:hypothetical protein